MTDTERALTGLQNLRDAILNDYIRETDQAVGTIDDAIELLKKQQPKTGHWIYEGKYAEAWDHICSECGKLMCTGVGTYAPYCWNCGAKMEIQL